MRLALRSTALGFLFLALAPAAWAASGEVAGILEQLTAVRSSKQDVTSKLQVNLSQKRENEKRFAANEHEAGRYQAKVADDTAYCSGTYQEPEYSRRVAECANRQRSLDAWAERLQNDLAAIQADEQERVDAAVDLKDRWDALLIRESALVERLKAFSDDNAACREIDDPEDAWHCMCEKWDACG